MSVIEQIMSSLLQACSSDKDKLRLERFDALMKVLERVQSTNEMQKDLDASRRARLDSLMVVLKQHSRSSTMPPSISAPATQAELCAESRQTELHSTVVAAMRQAKETLKVRGAKAKKASKRNVILHRKHPSFHPPEWLAEEQYRVNGWLQPCPRRPFGKPQP